MSSVRIIAGQFRSRRIYFTEIPGLRPTQDRIRETLFNWLNPFIIGASCLDLFSGSGVLGFECLSRGAKFNCFVDVNSKILAEISSNAEKLALSKEQYVTIRADVPKLATTLPGAPFDIIFLDPPFHQNLIQPTLNWLISSNFLKSNSLIYIEMEKDLPSLVLPESLTIYRRKDTPTLAYQLLSNVSKF